MIACPLLGCFYWGVSVLFLISTSALSRRKFKFEFFIVTLSEIKLSTQIIQPISTNHLEALLLYPRVIQAQFLICTEVEQAFNFLYILMSYQVVLGFEPWSPIQPKMCINLGVLKSALEGILHPNFLYDCLRILPSQGDDSMGKAPAKQA